jgi:hypothetical protein
MLTTPMATTVPDLPGNGSWWAEKAANLTSSLDPTRLVVPGTSARTAEAAREALREAGDAFCAHLGVTLKGDNFEASGVLDPSFWLIHPTTDRLFQAAALAFDDHHQGRQDRDRLLHGPTTASAEEAEEGAPLAGRSRHLQAAELVAEVVD